MSTLWDAATFVQTCRERSITLGAVMLERETTLREEEASVLWERMRENWKIMRNSALQAIERPIASMGGLIGGEANQMFRTRERAQMALGGLARNAMMHAMSVMEVNASMGLIVAAPTAGASGVLPGVLLALEKEYGFSEEELIDALFCAGAIGFLINQGATLAGAEGGCQAEVGSAAGMAAAATVQLLGGTPAQAVDAASIALINLMGLVCDPVRGLVESPCQLRNAQGAVTALNSAELVLSGVHAPAPLDQIIPIVYQVGQSLSPALRETAMGGLATAPCFQDGGCCSCGGCG